MITEKDLLNAIKECEAEPITAQKVGKLADFYIIYDHLFGQPYNTIYSEAVKPEKEIWTKGGSKFLLAINGKSPDKVWLATGGKANFKEQMLAPLIGHEVAVYPDADALDIWSKKVEALNSAGYHLCIPLKYQEMCTPEARAKKWDLVDMMLGKSKKKLDFFFLSASNGE